MGKSPLKKTNQALTGIAIPALLFRLGIDRETAADMFGLTVEDVVALERKTAGVSTRALSYLMALYGLFLRTGGSVQADLFEGRA